MFRTEDIDTRTVQKINGLEAQKSKALVTGAEAPENKSRKIRQEGTVAGCSSCTEGLAFPAEEAEARN